ncbi:MAG TPA: hypothetical protein VIM88_03805 [Sulfurovum sp.]|uniref:hypothetical protein n=1 Tax=Sulfurovum sp. TaxID=1969726 RepID=UPI002F94D123
MPGDKSNLEPAEIIGLYYKALYSGDLVSVKALMTRESYIMTLETFGLRLALRDPDFKAKLKKIEEDPAALEEVEKRLSSDLLSRNLSPDITIVSVSKNGDTRETVEYTEDGKSKKLYFSKEEEGWKINYYAGRKID